MTHKICLIVRDNAFARELSRFLKTKGYRCKAFSLSRDIPVLKQKVLQYLPELVILDLSPENIEGLKLAIDLSNKELIPVLFLSDLDQRETLQRISGIRYCHYLLKPFTMEELQIFLEAALERFHLERKNATEVQLYRNLVEGLNSAVFVCQDLNICFFNQRFASLVGISEEKKKTVFPITELVLKSYRREVVRHIRQLLRGERQPSVYSFPVIGSNGQEFFLEIQESLIEWNRAPALLGVVHDADIGEGYQDKLTNIKRIFEGINDGLVYVDLQGRVRELNPALESLTGLKREELLGKNAFLLAKTLLSGDYARKAVQAIKNMFLKQRFEPFEIHFQDRIFDVSGTFIKNPPGVIGVLHDVTHLKKIEQECREYGDIYRTIVENSHEAIVFVGEGFKVLYANEQSERLIGIERAKLIGRDFRSLISKETAETLVEYYLKRRRGEKVPSRYTLKVKNKKGKELWLLFSSSLVQNAAGEKFHIVQILDITDQTRAYESLIEQNRVYRDAPVVAFRWTKINQPAVYVSPNVKQILGYEPDDFLSGKVTFKAIIHPRDFEHMYRLTREYLEKKRFSFDLEYRVRHREGHYIWVRDHTVPVYNEDDEAEILDGFIFDITALKEVENRLRESEAKYRSILDNTLDGIFILQRGQIVYCNRSFARILGYEQDEELLGCRLETLIGKDDEWEGILNSPAGISPEKSGHPVQVELKARDGSKKVVELRFARVNMGGEEGIQGVMRDITETVLLERQLQHSQKMESVGQLAAGIAHDFNNVLSAILGSADYLLLTTPPDDPSITELKNIRASVKHAADLTKKLLAFSRQMEIHPELLDINKVIQDLTKILYRLIGEDITLLLELSRTPLYVKADPVQIEQVLINLIINARDAIEASRFSNRTIIVSTERSSLPQEYARTPDSQETPCVLLKVRDSGIGIRPEHLDRIWEPFFTTKGEGRGSGMGLSTIYGIVKQNGGEINVESEWGQGATFMIYWPLASETESKQQKQERKSIQPGSGRVLIVEDDYSVSRVLERVIEGLGYETVLCNDGVEALEYCQRQGCNFDLILTDIIMPRMGGVRLAEKLLAMNPECKILFMSGYIHPEKISIDIDENSLFFINKPFTVEKISNKIRQILNI